MIFGVENGSSIHSQSHKSNLLNLCEGPDDDINDCIGKL